jgi:hypothetical protein
MQQQGILIHQPPTHCQYSGGPCDQSFDDFAECDAFVVYASGPSFIAKTIQEGIHAINLRNPDFRIRSWAEMVISGQIVFCRICQNQRFARALVSDVSTLNPNVLFEIGYGIGLNLPIVAIRDTSFVRDKEDFDELGILDTLGYLDFENSADLAERLPPVLANAKSVFFQQHPLNQDQPLFVIKSPVATDGLIKLMSGVKKSGLRFRTFDPKETSRLSLHDAQRQVQSSLGVIAHLMSAHRRGARAHNARAAFLCGLAMACGKYVLMLQEGVEPQPIDYRDVVRSYSDSAEIQRVLGPFIQPLYEAFQNTRFVPITLPLKPLETLDFGDVAAENEINALKSYFVPTAQYYDVRRGHARLVVGRKGSGKTAIFYGVRNAYWTSQNHLVLDLKPEGHQFTKLRETVLKGLSQGMQEHVLTAFWNYLLLMELAHRVIESDVELAKRRPHLMGLYSDIRRLYGWDDNVEQGDFSERLLTLVDAIIGRTGSPSDITSTGDVTRLIYSTDIKDLNDILSRYLQAKEGVWLLIDNLDKSWPVSGASSEDILLLRCLMEATRKLQRQLARKNVEFHAAVFIRNDIYEHLLIATPDKGKDTAVVLEWSDREALAQLVRRRIVTSTGHQEPFEQLWSMFFDSHVAGEESFSYLLRRTLMRPRDLLRFLRECVNVAVNRGHNKVSADDVIQAENGYSEDQLQEVFFELRDISPQYQNILYVFIAAATVLSRNDILRRLAEIGMTNQQADRLIELLLWFGFLGIMNADNEDRYSYQYHYGVSRMLQDASAPIRFTIHPAFRMELGCVGD